MPDKAKFMDKAGWGRKIRTIGQYKLKCIIKFKYYNCNTRVVQGDKTNAREGGPMCAPPAILPDGPYNFTAYFRLK